MENLGCVRSYASLASRRLDVNISAASGGSSWGHRPSGRHGVANSECLYCECWFGVGHAAAFSRLAGFCVECRPFWV